MSNDGPRDAIHPARRIWRVIEVVHAVTYFAPESRAAASDAGLRGFWMGYFGFRAAPLGPVGPAVVAAAFHNFAPSMVARSLPDAWSYAAPEELLEVRARAAASVIDAVPVDVSTVAPAVDALWAFAGSADHGGRVLSASNAAVERSDRLLEALWQGCTTLREHRGDGHVAALTAAGLSGLDAHVLLSATEGVPSALLTDSRGWTVDEWGATVDALRARGLLDEDGAVTERGRRVRTRVEETTDELSWSAIEATIDDPDRVARALAPIADGIVSSGVIPFPNPMGLPAGEPSTLLDG